MNQLNPALRLTIFIGDCDKWHHKPLSAEIVHRGHQQGLAGASVVILDEVTVHQYTTR